MSYSKCAMPSLSCLLSFNTIPISHFFEFKEFFLFSSLPSFLCMHAYIKSSGFTGGKETKSPKKIAILATNGNVGLRVLPKFHDHTYAVLYAHCSVSSHCLRLVAIGFNYVTLP